MRPDQLLQGLGRTLGLPDLAFNQEGCARLVFDDTIAVNLEFEATNGRLHLYSELCSLPTPGREALLLALLEANLLGLETRGATLAVDSVSQDVVLCRSLSQPELNAGHLHDVVEAFVDSAEQWRNRIEAFRQGASESAHGSLDV